MLHNFLIIACDGHGYDDLADAADGFGDQGAEPHENDGTNPHYSAGDTPNEWRDKIAAGMHAKYMTYLASRTARQAHRDYNELISGQVNARHADRVQRAMMVSHHFASAVTGATRAATTP